MKGPALFPRGDNKEIAQIHLQTLKIFFLRTTGPISTKLSTKHPWVMGTHVCSNEETCPFPRGDNYEIVKIYWQTLKIIFSRTKLRASILGWWGYNLKWVRTIQFFFREDIYFSVNQHYGLNLSCTNLFIYWNWFSGERCGPWASCCIACDENHYKTKVEEWIVST